MEYVLGAVGLLIGGLVGFFAERAIRGTAFKTRDEILQQAQRDERTSSRRPNFRQRKRGCDAVRRLTRN